MTSPELLDRDSDAAFEIGRSLLLLEAFEGPDGLRKILRAGIPIVKSSPSWFHLTSRYATVTKKFQKRS